MPVVVVALPAPTPPGSAQALLEACSQGVREGRCVLSTDPTPEAEAAQASVTWDETDRVAYVSVEVTTGDNRGARRRTLAFKQSDARVERWRTVGLTIATLVGDVLHPEEAGVPSERAESTAPAASTPDENARTPQGNVEPAPTKTGEPEAPVVAVPASPPVRAVTTERLAPKAAQGRMHRSWVTLAVLTGPGLEDGDFRFGAGLDLGYRPAELPLFGRIAIAYAARPTDSRGLSIEWETLSLGLGAAFLLSALSLEPRIAFGLENVHAGISDPATGRNDAGNQLGVNARAGIDAVWQWPRLGIVGSFDGWRAHAPTQVLVGGQDSGATSGWGWTVGLGGRLFLD
jgi:hypothetical protein